MPPSTYVAGCAKVSVLLLKQKDKKRWVEGISHPVYRLLSLLIRPVGLQHRDAVRVTVEFGSH